MNNKHVAVAMSGGVDSSVTAALLKDQGYQVTGITMKIWSGENKPERQRRNSCYSPSEANNIKKTRAIARMLDIPFYVIDVTQEFRNEVIDYVSRGYLSGMTPNPCVRCNSRIKFDVFIRKAAESGIEFDYFATGHYARTEYDKSIDRWLLKKGRDPAKDQSYFLSLLSQEQLSRTLFPVGEFTKQEVREKARSYGLGIAEKPESQDFIAAGYRSLITRSKPGRIINTKGEVLGGHQGIDNYTIGQRKGIGISSRKPLFVTGIDPESDTVIVGDRDEIYSSELTAVGLNWIEIEKLSGEISVKARIRSSHEEAEAVLIPIDKYRARVIFEVPQMAITPGQAVVFYRDDIVIGGGTIERSGGGQDGEDTLCM